MSYKGKKILAIVPARGGSKGIPKKNLSIINGLTLIAHVAKVIQNLEFIDRAVLSTDDQEIAKEGIKNGLSVPFMRPADLASDTATAIDTWRHAWKESEKYYNMSFDISVLLEPTSPFRTSDDVKKTIKTLIDGNFSAAATVSENPAHFTPQKTLLIDEKNCIKTYLKDGEKFSIRQLIKEKYYHRNGIAYAITKECLFEKQTIIGFNCAAIVIDRYVINIDTPIELEFARFLFEKGEL